MWVRMGGSCTIGYNFGCACVKRLKLTGLLCQIIPFIFLCQSTELQLFSFKRYLTVFFLEGKKFFFYLKERVLAGNKISRKNIRVF